ncbi:hypothetical protein CASFOL_029769 [Castilleja foliolosa]|uniref:Peptidase A1 domain-containing protein n=1 Tax=Castilleja foliolosa TaxID=1961234 RepID=A0ABD3C8S4_9LAMI
MASYHHYSLLISLAIFISTTQAQNGPTLPIHKDPKTTQFYSTIQMGSHRAPINAVIDLGGPFLWFSCNNYTSNTYAPIPCGSTKCDLAKGIGCVGCNLPPRPGCTNDTCGSSPYNPWLDILVSQGFAEDTLYTQARRSRSVPKFLFSCMDKDFLEGLASGATGMLGLGRTAISLHKQVSASFKLPNKFSICFPSSGTTGRLTSARTPIYTEGDKSDEYFIDVKSIRVAGKQLSFKSSYLSIGTKGVGGTKISTLQNYTALHNSIYKPFARAFVKAAANLRIKSVASVGPFRACFSSDSIVKGPSGPRVPDIDLVLPGKDVYWRIIGANSMVEVDGKTMCLGFVDGGPSPRTSILIGAHQLDENLLEFDLVTSQLRFSSSLLVQKKICSAL